jgi:hypothetical protein
MSENTVTWSQSQKDAFSYIRRSVSEGISATSALKQYRDGGGSIRDNLWYSLYKETFSQEGWRETVAKLPVTYTVTDKMFQETDWDFREQYIMQMKVSGYSTELGQRITKWVTVENDTILTKQEWRWLAQEAASATLGTPPFAIDTFLEYAPLKRVR